MTMFIPCVRLTEEFLRNYVPKRPSDAPLQTLSILYDVPVGFVTPPPILRLCIALFAVAEGWLLLDIGLFVLVLHTHYHKLLNVTSDTLSGDFTT